MKAVIDKGAVFRYYRCDGRNVIEYPFDLAVRPAEFAGDAAFA
jgi:hypothetical protein